MAFAAILVPSCQKDSITPVQVHDVDDLSGYSDVEVLDFFCPNHVDATAIVCATLQASPESRDELAPDAAGYVLSAKSAEWGERSTPIDGNDQFCLEIPIGDSLSISIADACGATRYYSDLAAISGDLDLGTLELAPSTQQEFAVKFSVATTTSNDLALQVRRPDAAKYRGRQLGQTLSLRRFSTESPFQTTIKGCSEDTLSIRLLDLTAGTSSNWVVREVTDVIDAGNLDPSANQIDAFVSVYIDGILSYVYTGSSTSLEVDTTRSRVSMPSPLTGENGLLHLSLRTSQRPPYELDISGQLSLYCPIVSDLQFDALYTSQEEGFVAGPFADVVLQIHNYWEVGKSENGEPNAEFSGTFGPIRVAIDGQIRLLRVVFQRRSGS